MRDEIDLHLEDHHIGYLDYINYEEWKIENNITDDQIIDNAKDETTVTLEDIFKKWEK